MKWIFLAALIVLAPALAGLLRSSPRYLVPTCFLLGIALLLLGPTLWTAPYGWPMWPAPVHGLELSFVDSISVALLVSTRPVRIPLRVKGSYAILCAALAISTGIAFNPTASAFYVWQFLRTTLFFVAITRVYATEPRAGMALLAGLWTAMLAEPFWVALQHAQGVERAGGSLGHSNTFGIAADFIVLPAVACMLGGRRWLLPGLAVLAGFISVVLGGSRASMGLFAVGVILTVLLSIMHRSTPRKLALLGSFAVLLLVATPVMMMAVASRSAESLESSDRDRAAMKEAAGMIITDHPFGIGANQYAVVTNVGGYSERAGVPWNEDNRRAPVHNTYYLITAELGFVGLIGLIALLGSFIVLGFSALRRHLPDETGEMVPGLLATMVILSVHISYEYTFMVSVVHYLFAMSAGILVAISVRAKSAARPAATAGSTLNTPSALSHAG